MLYLMLQKSQMFLKFAIFIKFNVTEASEKRI
jgi:hypothetical protein